MTDLQRVLLRAVLLGLIVFLCADAGLAQTIHYRGAARAPAPAAAPTPRTPAADPIDEVEPNNNLVEAQVLAGETPLVVNGSVELGDLGELDIFFNDGAIVDDIEDLFFITLTAPGVRLTLDGFFPLECDLYLFEQTGDSTFAFIDGSINEVPEVIDQPELAAGTYLVGVALFEPFPGGESTAYVLTVEGALATPVEAVGAVPEAVVLAQNYPNPSASETWIAYHLPTRATVRLEVFDARGRRVRTLVDAPQAAGLHRVRWDGLTHAGLPAAAGAYLYRLQAGPVTKTRTLVLLR